MYVIYAPSLSFLGHYFHIIRFLYAYTLVLFLHFIRLTLFDPGQVELSNPHTELRMLEVFFHKIYKVDKFFIFIGYSFILGYILAKDAFVPCDVEVFVPRDLQFLDLGNIFFFAGFPPG